MFVFGIGITFVKKTVIFNAVKRGTFALRARLRFKCHFYVCFTNAVFESVGVELNGNIHVFSILLTAIGVNS
jgi:hypothetical protein